MNDTNNTGPRPDERPGEPSLPAPPPADSAVLSRTEAKPASNTETEQLLEGTRTIEWLQFGANALLGVIGIVALCIYGGQLSVMRGTLETMKQSSSQTTDQVWRAIGNLNWMAQSMDTSQKQNQRSLEATLREMQKQTSGQKGQLALALRQDERSQEQLARPSRP
jgi:hypothetical protein